MTADKITPTLTTVQKLNLETARISWEELQKFFARGLVIIVDPGLDLVETASKFVDDHGDEIAELLADARIRKAGDEDAKKWNASDAELWAVVTAPWVLVQET